MPILYTLRIARAVANCPPSSATVPPLELWMIEEVLSDTLAPVGGLAYLAGLVRLNPTVAEAKAAAAILADAWTRRALHDLAERMISVAVELQQDAAALTSRAGGGELAESFSERMAILNCEVAGIVIGAPAQVEQSIALADFPGTAAAWITPAEMLAVALLNEQHAAQAAGQANVADGWRKAELHLARARFFRDFATAAVQP